MTQNLGRLPIVSDTTRSWSVVENPFGEEPEVAGWAVSMFDPVTREHSVESDIFATREEAVQELADIFAAEAA